MTESQISLDELGFSNFKRMLDVIIPKKERKQSSIIITYLRIYTHLNNSINLLTKEGFKRAMDHLNIAKNIIKQIDYPSEKLYLKKLNETIDPLLKNKEELFNRIIKEEDTGEQTDPYHCRTSLLLAQNICILRILKINKG